MQQEQHLFKIQPSFFNKKDVRHGKIKPSYCLQIKWFTFSFPKITNQKKFLKLFCSFIILLFLLFNDFRTHSFNVWEKNLIFLFKNKNLTTCNFVSKCLKRNCQKVVSEFLNPKSSIDTNVNFINHQVRTMRVPIPESWEIYQGHRNLSSKVVKC